MDSLKTSWSITDPDGVVHSGPALEPAGARASAPDALRAEGGGAAAPQEAGTAAGRAPRRLGELLGWLDEKWEEATCLECREPFHRLRATPVSKVQEWCPGCVERARQAERTKRTAAWVLEHAEEWLNHFCVRAGMSPRECTATLEGLTQAVRTTFHAPAPGLTVRAMIEGRMPARGFGLSGGAGSGKTFALAAVVRRWALERLKIEAPTLGKRATRQWLLWVRWPEEVGNARACASHEGGMQEVERRTQALVEAEALVLDDLGAERIKGADYSEDWATSILDRVVDQRFNALRPTWWTTNLSPEEFASRYGARIFSRLHGDSPLAMLPASAPDQRVVRK